MNHDIEKNRSEYVTRLEATLAHAQNEAARFKAIAEKWEPRATTQLDPVKQLVTVGLEFGGKFSHAQITFQSMANTDPTTAISAIVDALIESNVASRLREALEPEVTRLLPSVKASLGAGKW